MSKPRAKQEKKNAAIGGTRQIMGPMGSDDLRRYHDMIKERDKEIERLRIEVKGNEKMED